MAAQSLNWDVTQQYRLLFTLTFTFTFDVSAQATFWSLSQFDKRRHVVYVPTRLYPRLFLSNISIPFPLNAHVSAAPNSKHGFPARADASDAGSDQLLAKISTVAIPSACQVTEEFASQRQLRSETSQSAGEH